MEDELEDALANQQQPQPQQNGTNWDGRVAVNRQTGERLVYRMNATGRGRFVALNSENADPQSRERVEGLQNVTGVGERTLGQARNFVRQNFSAATGGLQNTLTGDIRSLAAAVRPNMFSRADQLSGLSSQMVGSNWMPGTTGMMNTTSEMEQIRARYPSPTAQGPANMQTYLTMAEDVAVQRAALNSMREWLQRRPNLEGWEEDFTRREPQIRQRARASAETEMRESQGQLRPNLANTLARGGPAASRQTAPSAPSGGLAPGTVQRGYRYRGGDPAKRENWEPVL
jgi:hypothetical protein